MSVLDSVFKWLAHARYNVTTPTYSDGDQAELQTTSSGRLKVDAVLGADDGAKLWSLSGAATSERIVKASSGKLFRVLASNPGASVAYLFLYNSATRPTNGSTAAIVPPIAIAAGSDATVDLQIDPYDCTVGIYWGASSTHDDFTYDNTATLLVSVRYT